MCHPPLLTGMERIKVLSSLRLPEIVFPVSDNLTGKEVYYKLMSGIKLQFLTVILSLGSVD